MLKDLLKYCIINFDGSWYSYLPKLSFLIRTIIIPVLVHYLSSFSTKVSIAHRCIGDRLATGSWEDGGSPPDDRSYPASSAAVGDISEPIEELC